MQKVIMFREQSLRAKCRCASATRRGKANGAGGHLAPLVRKTSRVHASARQQRCVKRGGTIRAHHVAFYLCNIPLPDAVELLIDPRTLSVAADSSRSDAFNNTENSEFDLVSCRERETD